MANLPLLNLMQMTRPRTVTGPKSKFTNLFDLDNISNPVNPSLSTPPINPNAPSIIKPKASGMDILSNIISAISTGVGIGFSQNPGEALMQQLNQQRNEKLQREQLELEKQERERQRQFEAQQRQIDRQLRREEIDITQGFQSTEAQKERQFKITEAEKERGFRIDERNADIESKKELMKLSQEFEKNQGAANRDFQMKVIEAQQKGGIEEFKIKSVYSLLGANVSAEKVFGIMNKLERGEELNKDDFALINRAYKILTTPKKTGGTATQGMSEKAINTQVASLAAKILMDDDAPEIGPDGKPVMQTNFMTGETKPVMRRLTDAEKLERLQNIIPVYKGALVQINTPQARTQTQVDSQSIESNQVFAEIDAGLKNGANPDAIITAINQQISDPKLKEQAIARVRSKTKKLSLGGKALKGILK